MDTTLVKVLMEALRTIQANSEGPVNLIAAYTLNMASNIMAQNTTTQPTPKPVIGFVA